MSESATLEHILGQMEGLLVKLQSPCRATWETLDDLPNKGVYAFYEGDKPLYVGRSNRLRQRVKEHGQPGSRTNKATFAYRLLANEYGLPMGHDRDHLRSEVADEHDAEFREQKKRVRNMSVQAVGICDDTVAYFFEAYAIVALDTTKYNKFEPH